jgi:hypothetical protein
MLQHLYPSKAWNPPAAKRQWRGKIIKFDQTELTPDGTSTASLSLDSEGYIYVPTACVTGGGGECIVHLSLHGCLQGASVYGMGAAIGLQRMGGHK